MQIRVMKYHRRRLFWNRKIRRNEWASRQFLMGV
jgi:hypothetical protein